MRLYTKLSILACTLFSFKSFAQPSVQKLKQDLTLKNSPVIAEFKINPTMKQQASLTLTRNVNLPLTAVKDWLTQELKLRVNTDVLMEKDLPVKFGKYEVRKMQQFYKGIKVEHGIINATAKDGNTQMLQLEFYQVKDDFKTTPLLSESSARDFALKQTGAQTYAWQASPELYSLPGGELVIIADFNKNAEMVLAYKFEIYAVEPLSKAYVYINANDGSLVLRDNIIKHANTNGTAKTRFSGRQTIVTDFDAAAPAGKQYRLRQTKDGHDIRTLNYANNPETPANTVTANTTDFTDNDNNWDSTEYGPKAKPTANLDDAALDAHFNMTLVNDYWKEMHGRNSWDNNGSHIISYVHVAAKGGGFMNNAYWNGSAMFFGDGDGALDPPQVSIDDAGHEFAHAICQTTSALVYRWESGALNEGFSDIWAACATNFLKKKYPAIPGSKDTWRLFEESSNQGNLEKGLRDMSDPTIFANPDTYKDGFWAPASFEDCRTPDDSNNPTNNDLCGVHNNSGVLNKWFYLLTNGGNGTNFFNLAYNVAGIGFGKSDSIAYLTELNLTPNAGYRTASAVSLNAAITLYGDNAEAQAVRNAWIAVGVDTAVYNMANTPVFLSNSFSQVVVGRHGCIWAGTTTAADNISKGVYRYDGIKWVRDSINLQNNAVQGMTVDKNGGIWIAQSGRTGAQALTGGVNYYPDSSLTSLQFYSATSGVSSRNTRSIFVDTTRANGANPMVWVAALAQLTSGVSANGGVSTGLNAASPFFSNINAGINRKDNIGGAQTIGGNNKEIWAYSGSNFDNQSMIIRYDAATRDSIGFYDDSTVVPQLVPNFLAKSIYFDALGNKWIGMQSNGLVVMDKNGTWYKLDTATYRTILPTGVIINNNAITGDKSGNVYIGTTNGLIYYNKGPVNDIKSYRRFTTVHGLPSNNVRGIAIDTGRYKLIIATDNGIMFFDQQCANSRECWSQPNKKSGATTLGNGNWSDPSIWSTNLVPDKNTIVTILNNITVDIDGECNRLNVQLPGAINVLTGKKLNIEEGDPPTIQTRTSRKY
ncbi:MAG: M4 family metallopeptidase [Ferruginibacter sp.]